IFIYEKVYRQSTPEGHFLLANFSQKFDQKLASSPEGISYSWHIFYNVQSLCTSVPFTKKYIASPHPKGSFYSIFCEKIVFDFFNIFDGHSSRSDGCIRRQRLHGCHARVG
ncbi:MAG: hypothetical protein KAS74_04430, partial [Methanosarcinales archaeon]|nr:hypothetical protein [Methanosarcinales archaeon]